MPMMPPSRCSGCQRLISGRCQHCARAHEKARGTRQERGYDEAWLKLREAYIERHPLCERCAARDLVTVAEEVHHKQPFAGPSDPLRLDWSNLEATCIDCHHAYHKELRRQGGQTSRPPSASEPARGKVSQGHDGPRLG